jgi:hypothetical protein
LSYLAKKFQDNVKELVERTGKKSIYQQRLEYQKILERIPHDEEGNVVYKDPDLFYHTFGHVFDSFTRAEITKLSSYQRLFWHAAMKFDNLICVKTNKAGISTVGGMVIFQNSMLRRGAGREKLIIAQKAEIARDHLDHLKRDILNSPVFYDSVDLHKTTATQLYLNNPYDPWTPTKIKAIGNSPGGVVSWRDVDFVWISDLAASEKTYDNVLNGAMTRLALTRGKMIIETIPGRLKGKIYDIWKDAQRNLNSFVWIKIPCYAAVEEGIMSLEHVEDQKKNLGSDFPLFYEAEFSTTAGTIISKESINQAVHNGEFLRKHHNSYKTLNHQLQLELHKSLGVDIGLSTSKSAFVILANRGNFIELVHAEELDSKNMGRIFDRVMYLMHKHHVTRTFIDAQWTGLIYDLKKQIPERMNKLNEARLRSISLRDLGLKSPFKINPIAFKRYHLEMIYHIQRLFSEEILAIDESEFPQLVHEIRNATIVPTAQGAKLDKKTFGTMDLFDAFRLSAVGHSFQ